MLPLPRSRGRAGVLAACRGRMLLACLIALCGVLDDVTAAESSSKLIAIDGPSTGYPIGGTAGAEFAAILPAVKIRVGASGNGGGFKRFCAGELDIATASRPMSGKEFEQAKVNRIRFLGLPVAIDALYITVSPQNTWCDQLSLDDLRRIYTAGQPAARWIDLNAAWPAQTIKVHGPDQNFRSFDYFNEMICPSIPGGRQPQMREDIICSCDDQQLVDAISTEVQAICYFGVGLSSDMLAKVRAVPIRNPATGTAVSPSPEHLASGAYAHISRPLFIYVNAESLDRPEVAAFVKFYLANDDTFASRAGYVPVPEAIRKRAQAVLAGRLTGSCMVMPDGSRREGALSAVYLPENLRCMSQ